MAFSILLVDDSMPMRGVIRKTFTAAGYGRCEYHEASNGREALDILKSTWVDIVVSDYNMPVMNGLELLQEMKKDELFKEIPMVIISTEGSKNKIDAFRQNGAAGYIQKPFVPEAVRDLITELLGEVNDGDEFDDSDDELDF